MKRYQQLEAVVDHVKPQSIAEVGTCSGDTGLRLAEIALKHHPKVHYTGYDLFEDATDESDTRELNVKKHHTVAEVGEKFRAFADKHPGFTWELVKGDTRETLKNGHATPDFVFIDGGHSIETVKSDYEAFKGAKTIVFDDYYQKDNEGQCPDITKYGCNQVVDELNVPGSVIHPGDAVLGGGRVHLVVTPQSASPFKQNLVVRTKNCVADEVIQTNVRYSMPKIKTWVRDCHWHDETATIVSGGPSLKDLLPELKDKPNLVCVKHSHDTLIENGIIPWACALLDPRGHVKEFIENPHPDVIYFTASMVDQTTLDRLIEKKARIVGYHAAVGAGEEKVIKELGGGILIGGGSTSAMRIVSVLYSLGFRRFDLYAFDSCYWEPQDKKVLDKRGQQRFYEVDVAGRKFWTDTELIAQCQDFEKLMKDEKGLQLNVYGDGIIPHIWNSSMKKPHFRDVLNAR